MAAGGAANGAAGCAQGDLDRMIAQLRTCKPLLEADVKRLCVKATEILVEEGNVQQVSTPITMYECVSAMRVLRSSCVVCERARARTSPWLLLRGGGLARNERVT